MGRIYTAQFNGVAVTAQQDLFELTAGSNCAVVVHELCLSQTSEIGDAQEEGLLILIKSGQTTSGSGGTSVTPVASDFGDAAATATVEANNTTKASVGTIVTHYPLGWNVRAPYPFIWTPETRLVMRPSRRMTVELATTPADSITMHGYLVFEEIG
jgi:hypothetical protein